MFSIQGEVISDHLILSHRIELSRSLWEKQSKFGNFVLEGKGGSLIPKSKSEYRQNVNLLLKSINVT